MGKLPYDYFYNNTQVFGALQSGVVRVADGYVENIRRAIADIQHSHITLGYALIAFAESHTFGTSLGSSYRQCSVETFFYVCEHKFHLDKTSISRHVNVVYRFGDGIDKLRSSYRDKSFSYLCELLPLSDHEVDHCLIHCHTVADVRAYKSSLKESVATSQQTKPTVQSNVNFYDEIVIPLSSSSNEFVRYDRFRGMKISVLIEQFLSMEAELRNLQNLSLCKVISDGSSVTNNCQNTEV